MLNNLLSFESAKRGLLYTEMNDKFLVDVSQLPVDASQPPVNAASQLPDDAPSLRLDDATSQHSDDTTIQLLPPYVSSIPQKSFKSNYSKVLDIVMVDRTAPFDKKRGHGKVKRAIEYEGDHTVRSLLISHISKRLGKKLLAGTSRTCPLLLLLTMLVAGSAETSDQIAQFVYESNNPALTFQDTGFKSCLENRLRLESRDIA
jgi:hypothetical protein